MSYKDYPISLDIMFDHSDKNYRVNVPRFMVDDYIKDTLKDKKIKSVRRLDNYQIFYNQLELF